MDDKSLPAYICHPLKPEKGTFGLGYSLKHSPLPESAHFFHPHGGVSHQLSPGEWFSSTVSPDRHEGNLSTPSCISLRLIPLFWSWLKRGIILFFSTPSQQLMTVLWVEVIIMAYNGKSMTFMFFYGANEGGPGYQDTRKIPSWLWACCLNAGGGDFPETLFIHSSNASLYVRICKHWALGSFPLHKPRPTSSYVCCQEGRLVYCTEMPLALSIFHWLLFLFLVVVVLVSLKETCSHSSRWTNRICLFFCQTVFILFSVMMSVMGVRPVYLGYSL